jgi:hypothetical protein
MPYEISQRSFIPAETGDHCPQRDLRFELAPIEWMTCLPRQDYQE